MTPTALQNRLVSTLLEILAQINTAVEEVVVNGTTTTTTKTYTTVTTLITPGGVLANLSCVSTLLEILDRRRDSCRPRNRGDSVSTLLEILASAT